MKVISIRQPWAWLIVNGHKDIENRSWPTKYRGPVLIHASKGMTHDEYEAAFLSAFGIDKRIIADMPEFQGMQRGGIVGIAEIVDCVSKSASPWFMGEFGFVLRNCRTLPFQPMRGMLGLFDAPEGFEVTP